jgi:hypothetical protein
MPSERTAWLAELRRNHRPETILTLCQLQELGPGLLTTQELVELLGVQASSTNLALGRLKRAGLVRYEGWPKKGRLIWWIARHDDHEPDPTMYPRWVLRANAAKSVEVLFGREREAAQALSVHWKTMSNFLSGRYGKCRLLGEWEIRQDPIDYITGKNAYFPKHRASARDRDQPGPRLAS